MLGVLADLSLVLLVCLNVELIDHLLHHTFDISLYLIKLINLVLLILCNLVKVLLIDGGVKRLVSRLVGIVLLRVVFMLVKGALLDGDPLVLVVCHDTHGLSPLLLCLTRVIHVDLDGFLQTV